MRFLYFLLAAWLPMALSAQHVSTRLYTVEDGLPATEIHSLALSPEGELLLCFGLGRIYSYDGERFVRHFDSLRQSPTQMFWDREQTLWLIAYGMVVAQHEGQVYSWTYLLSPGRDSTNLAYASGDTISQAFPMHHYGSGELVLVKKGRQDNRIFRFDPSKGVLELAQTFTHAESDDYIDRLLVQIPGLSAQEKKDLKQQLLVNYFLAADLIDLDRMLPLRVKNHPAPQFWVRDGEVFEPELQPQVGLDPNHHFDYYYSERDREYVLLLNAGEVKHVYYLDENLRQKTYFTFRSPSQIRKIVKDGYGTLWAATHDGLLRIFPQFTNFFVDELENPVLSSVHSVQGDGRGKVWFGSYGGGFAYIQEDRLRVPDWNAPYRVLPGAIADGAGGLLFVSSAASRTTPRGLFRIGPGSSLEHLDLWHQGYYLGRNRRGQLLYGTQREGLLVQQRPGCFSEDCWEKYGPAKGFGLTNVLSAQEDDQGRYWMTRPSAGLAVYLPDQDTIFNFLRKEGQYSYSTIATYQEPDGSLFFGTQRGLGRFRPPEILRDDQSADDWLSPLDTTLHDEERYVYAIKPADEQFLVYTSNKGMHLLDKNSLENPSGLPVDFHFQSRNGYLGLGGEQNAIWVDSLREEIWMANPRGITRFNRRFFYPQQEKPELLIDAIGGVYSPGSEDGVHIRLEDAPEFTIRYHLRRTLDPFTDEYYRLQLDDGPPVLTRDSIFFLQELGPGQHELKIQGFRNGIASDSYTLNLDLPGPIYREAWFIGLLLLLISSLVLAGYFYLQNARRKERELSALRIRNLTDNFSPHFLGNSFNWIKNRAKLSQDEAAAEIISKMDRMVRVLFERGKQKQATHSLAEELQLLQNYFDIQSVRYGDAHQYHIGEIDPDIPLEDIHIPILTLQILCDNAIEHGLKKRPDGRGQVWVKIEEEKLGYTILVEDDGIGRHRASQFVSQGYGASVKMLQDLIEELNKKNSIPFLFRYEDGIFSGDQDAYGTRGHLFVPKNYHYAI